MELIGLYLAGCGLLAAAGAAKIARPDGTARAIARIVPWRTSFVRWSVRLGGAAEAALAVTAVAYPGRPSAGLVAASYLLFASFVAAVRRRGGPLSTCGCFGSPDLPATWLHVAIDLGFAASAAAVAVAAPSGDVVAVLRAEPWSGVPLVLAGAVCGWLAYLVMSPLAVLGEARRLVQRRAGRPH